MTNESVRKMSGKVSMAAWLAMVWPVFAVSFFFLKHLHRYPEAEGSTIRRWSPKLDDIIPVGAKVELIAGGFGFTEGVQWLHDPETDGGYLIFSDVVTNKMWKWQERGGIFASRTSLFLEHSGCDEDVLCSGLDYPGSNGLWVLESGDVFICEHGNRRVTHLAKDGTRTTLATHFNGTRLNSPNDVAFSERGDLYFTDPPFGLPLVENDPDFPGRSGVYRIRKEAQDAAKAGEAAALEPELVENDFTLPTGLGFSPDSTKFYLGVGDNMAWYVYDVAKDGELTNRRLFYEMKNLPQGLPVRPQYGPDGLQVDELGNIFATAPAGVLILSPDGSPLGMIDPGVFAANVAMGRDGYLYMAARQSIMRIKVSTKTLGWQ